MELISFSKLKYEIDEFLKNKTIDYFYLGVGIFLSEKYTFLQSYETFSDWCVSHYEKISSLLHESKIQIAKSRDTIQSIKKSMEEIDLIIKKLEDKDILNERIKRLDVKNKKEKEIQTILSFENTESYKTQINSLRKEIAELEKWIIENSPNELEIKINTKNNERIILEKRLEIAQNELEDSTKKIEMLSGINEEDEFNAIVYIACILFKTVCTVKKVDKGNFHSKKYVLEITEDSYNNKQIEISSSAVESIIINQNRLYTENWKELIANYFKKPLNLSDIYAIKKVDNFPDWGYNLFSIGHKTEIEPIIVAVWLSMQNSDFSKFLITKDNKIFLWISDYIFVEIVLRQPIKTDTELIAIYLDAENKYKFVDEKIVGGYTSSGYYLPHWLYIVDKEIIIELFFHQNALLGNNFIKEINFDNQRKSVEKKEEERLRDDD